MNAIVDQHRAPDGVLLRADGAASAVRAAGTHIERLRELPHDLLSKLHEARLFRLLLPKALDGDELDPVMLARTIEIIAAADASTAWCLGQGAGCAMSAAFLEPEPAQEIFGPANAVLAWGAGIQGKAVAVDGGYRVSGRWTFASGSRHATWLGGHCFVFEQDGRPRTGANGRQVDRTALFRREQAEVFDDWQVLGLRGTGSDSYAVQELFVAEDHTIDRENPAELRETGPVYRLSTTQVYASAFSGLMLGIARGMLDDLIELARTKTPRGAASSLRDSQMFHAELGLLEARLRAARAGLHAALENIWSVVANGGTPGIQERGSIRLATTHAINEGRDVVADAYRLAGQNAIFENAPFERRLRDAHAASQQVQGRKTHYATVGRILLGLEPDTEMFI